MISPIKLEQEHIDKLLEMTNILYGDFILSNKSNHDGFWINTKEGKFQIHWYELLINHLVPGIYQFGLEEFCLEIECYLTGQGTAHLVDTVYNRFELHIKNSVT
jgi:hypothetical protein